MKTTLTILFTSLIALASVAQGDTYRTLNGYQATIQIPDGETAFVVSATTGVVIGVQSAGKRELQYRFAEGKGSCVCQTSYSSYRNFLPTPSIHSPVPIAGPAKLVIRTSGMITISLPEATRRATTTSSRSVRRFAKN